MRQDQQRHELRRGGISQFFVCRPVGIGVGAVLFATFFPETLHASRRFRRQILVHLSRLASACRPDVRSYERALCEQLWTMLAGLKDEPAAAHSAWRVQLPVSPLDKRSAD